MDSKVNTIPAALYHWTTTDPDTPAFIFIDITRERTVLTRADVYRLASRYAAILRRCGVQPGHIVCNTLHNSPQRLLTDLGVILAGGVTMNGQVFLADGDDLVESLKEAACFAIILDPKQPKGASRLLEKRVHTQHGSTVDFAELPDLKLVLKVHWKTEGKDKALIHLLNEETDGYVADVKPRDLAAIFATSGSTGFSKLVPWTHESMVILGNQFYEVIGPEAGEIYYNNRSLGWAGGFPHVYLNHGTTRVLLDVSKGQPEDPVSFEWEVICSERCNVAFIAPSLLLQMTDLWEQGKPQDTDATDQGTTRYSEWKFRSVSVGGQPTRKKHLEAIGKITDCIRPVYGCTEVGLISYKVVTSQEDFEDCNNGTPLSGVELRVVDKELKDVAVGEMGEVLVRSPQMSPYYHVRVPEVIRHAFTSDGWYRTGDVGYLNDKGEVMVVCRLSFSIMRGSYLVYPGWLERRIGRCPGIQDVLVVPVPDPVLHQELCACIVPSLGAQLTSERVREFCTTLFLTSEKSEMTAIPKYYIFFNAFPTTIIGKTCRHTTAVVARQRLGLEETVPALPAEQGQ